MTQRLIWNFEFSPPPKSAPVHFVADDQDDLKWEARYFWSEHEIISLSAANIELLDIANYQQKHREDIYFLIARHPYNIKYRRNELLYKPLLKKTKHAFGFGTKINLESPHHDALHSKITPEKLKKIKHQVNTSGKELLVKKEAFIYKFTTTPTIKLELARLEINHRVYFSVCVEGKSLYLVETISEGLLGKQVSCDYVTFLKNIIKL